MSTVHFKRYEDRLAGSPTMKFDRCFMKSMRGVLNAMMDQNGGFCGPELRNGTKIAGDIRNLLGPERPLIAP